MAVRAGKSANGVLLGFGAPHKPLLLVGRGARRTIPLTDVHAAPWMLKQAGTTLSLRGGNMKRREFITLPGSGRYWPNSDPTSSGLVCESKNPPQLFSVGDFEGRLVLISVSPEPSPSG
jgi:hypothetical protein